MNIFSDLFFTFAKIGLFTFGGGYAMISIIEDNCVDRKKWITHDEMMNITVIAESTPGPIAINAATYIGFKQARLLGAFIATAGMILPSMGIIYLISMFFDRFLELAMFANAFKGIKLAVGLLILDAGISMTKKMKKSNLSSAILLCALVVMLAVNLFSIQVSSIALMTISAAVSLSAYLMKGGEKK
ncbi:MAG: chromate transporter [Lachnospiraceae bacterium]|jgi:chromate transporter|nr:chromate transporter [Lachnospiraceae bacterium]